MVYLFVSQFFFLSVGYLLVLGKILNPTSVIVTYHNFDERCKAIEDRQRTSEYFGVNTIMIE